MARTVIADTLLTASLIAADLAAAVDRDRADLRGFMQRDVRYFYLLFRNWLEHDVRDPDRDIDLTQIRRACEALHRRRRLAIVAPRPTSRPRARAPGATTPRRPRRRHVLTLAGLLALVDDLVAWRPERSFEDGLFVILFAAAYRALVLRRAEQAGAPTARARLARALDPRVLIATLRRGLTRQRDDLRERMASGDQLLAASTTGLLAGQDDATIIRRLVQISPYQLHHIRPLGELLLALPPAIRRFELTDGITARRDLLFAPLLQQAELQLALLAQLEPRAKELAADRRR